MTPDEAIKTIRENLLSAPEPWAKALWLGVEALEKLKLLRENIPHRNIYALIEQLLPSETEEVK